MVNSIKKRINVAIILILIVITTMIFIGIFSICRNKQKDYDWGEPGEVIGYLTIDAMNLKDVEVRKGTDKATLREGIGLYISEHEDPQQYNGNICLFSNSTGDEKNYFRNIQNINVGDRIEYLLGDEQRVFVVYQRELLADCKTSHYLEPTKENKITLITQASKSTTMSIIIQASELEEERDKIANVKE